MIMYSNNHNHVHKIIQTQKQMWVHMQKHTHVSSPIHACMHTCRSTHSELNFILFIVIQNSQGRINLR